MFKGFQKPKRLVANTDTLTDRYGMFTAQPFERGFGTTIGNSLRRVLLSSIEGAAITAVRIEGVAHEFSPIPGVVEDATDIILNLKQVPFKMSGEGVRTARLRIEEPGEVLSSQIETDQDVEVLDRTVHIATVSDGGKLNIELRLKQGRGYVGADRNFDEDLPLGYIPIDSVHSPVRKVNFSVEGARLGQMTDYDKLTLEVWSNGAISPQDAIGQAAKLMKDHQSIFINFEEVPEMAEEQAERAMDQMNEILNRSVDELELSVRSYNCLKNANIQTIADLVQKTEAEMLRTKNFGRKSLNEIKEILSSMGLQFGMKFDAQGRLISGSGQPVTPNPPAERPRDEDEDAQAALDAAEDEADEDDEAGDEGGDEARSETGTEGGDKDQFDETLSE
jgi:DNA-directed RNA polymerase subunit alpha